MVLEEAVIETHMRHVSNCLLGRFVTVIVHMIWFLSVCGRPVVRGRRCGPLNWSTSLIVRYLPCSMVDWNRKVKFATVSSANTSASKRSKDKSNE